MDKHLYTAIESGSFPCNPIPFANGLAEHVREHGTDSIKSDEAKRILWILMAQAYGQLATIDLCDEWDRLTSKVAWTKEQALKSFRSHNPSTKAFEALNIPFEYFVQLSSCHRTKEDVARICDGIVEHYTSFNCTTYKEQT